MQKILVNDDYYYDMVRKNVRKYRKIKKLTQQELADLTNLSRDFICDIESIHKNKGFSIATVGRIAEALEIEMLQLFQSDIERI